MEGRNIYLVRSWWRDIPRHETSVIAARSEEEATGQFVRDCKGAAAHMIFPPSIEEIPWLMERPL